MKVLLDSVIVIDYLNGIENAQSYVDELGRQAGVSVVTIVEVLVGTDDEGLEATEKYVDSFPLLPIDRKVAGIAARQRRAHRWKLPDAFQAAVALRYGLQFATRNTKDFAPDVHEFVTAPYELKIGGGEND